MDVISLSTYYIFLLPPENIFLLSKEALKFCATFVEQKSQRRRGKKGPIHPNRKKGSAIELFSALKCVLHF